jgi:translation machinery-associated protein 16
MKDFHPESRKAGQLARSQLRKSKLSSAAAKRGKRSTSQVDVFGFFFHAMPDAGVLTLAELHALVCDIWLTRHDTELEQERALRRKGRPKSAKEVRLEETQLREREEYRTGMEVPDLTHPPTVEVFRRWDQKEVAFVQLLRFIRISSDAPDVALVSRPGKHFTITRAEPQDQMEVDADGGGPPIANT